jgi:hypothetical protein
LSKETKDAERERAEPFVPSYPPTSVAKPVPLFRPLSFFSATTAPSPTSCGREPVFAVVILSMDNPPKSPPSPVEPKPRSRWSFGCAGAAGGGCLVPMVLFFIAAAMGDVGGPLFWPIICVPLALIGFATGMAVYEFVKDRRK